MNRNFHFDPADPVRLGELAALHVLDSPAEEQFDRLTRMASRTLEAPIALVSLVDDHRQFFKSAHGLPEPWATRRETPLSHSFCQHVVASRAALVVDDARRHPLVCENQSISALGVIAYLGIPLTLANGVTLGSFCVIDTKRRTWSDSEQALMGELASVVIGAFQLRSANYRIEQQERSLQYYRAMLLAARQLSRLSGLLLSEDEVLPDDDRSEAGEHLLVSVPEAFRRALSMGHAEPGRGLQEEAGADTGNVSLNALRHRLTDRQRQVFDLLLRGLQTKEIARHLGLSPRTVEVHRGKILERLEMSNFSQLLKQLLAQPNGH
jgi:DNA-binding CsgD family transcriptional regulator